MFVDSVYLTKLSMAKIIELGCRWIITAPLVEWHWGRKPRYSEEETVPAPICSQQTPHRPASDRIRDTTVT